MTNSAVPWGQDHELENAPQIDSWQLLKPVDALRHRVRAHADLARDGAGGTPGVLLEEDEDLDVDLVQLRCPGRAGRSSGRVQGASPEAAHASEPPLVVARDRLVREGHLLSSRLVVSHQGRADALGLGPTDLLCLELIGGEGETTAGRLAELLQLTTGAVTGVLDRLERSGYIRRERDTDDRRRVLVRISPERQRHLSGLLDPLAAALDEVAEPWSTDELRFAIDFIQRLHPALAAESARLRPDGGSPAGGADPAAQTLPGGGLRQARLDVPEGLSNFTIEADPSLPELVSTSLKGRPPSLELDGNTVTMRLKRQSIFRAWTGSGRLTLSGAVRWDIVRRGGVYRLTADLRKLDLAGLVLSGGVHRMDVSLPDPKGTVPPSTSAAGRAASASTVRLAPRSAFASTRARTSSRSTRWSSAPSGGPPTGRRPTSTPTPIATISHWTAAPPGAHQPRQLSRA